MANEDFAKVIFKDVEFKYPRLGDTFRFNTSTRQSEPCPPTANGAAWTINWEMAYDKAKPIYEQLKSHYESRHAAGRVKAPFHTIFGMKKLENGNVEFRAKRNGTRGSSGEVNKPPMVIGADKQPLADVNIWGGSKGTVRCWAAPVTDPDAARRSPRQFRSEDRGGLSSPDPHRRQPRLRIGGREGYASGRCRARALLPRPGRWDPDRV